MLTLHATYSFHVRYSPFLVEAEYNAHFVAFETLLRESDVIVICVPLNKSTRHLIGAAQFEKMKTGVVVVNIARGPIIDEAALVAALDSGKVSSAGLDVYEFEPKVHEGLLKHPNCTLLPHMGTFTEETSLDMEVWKTVTDCNMIARIGLNWILKLITLCFIELDHSQHEILSDAW